jgi:Zn-finger protein
MQLMKEKYKKYNVNVDYFKTIDNRQKAYWLGFLCADGNVSVRYHNGNVRAIKLEFCLQGKDKYILEQFKLDINSNAPLVPKYIKNKYLNYRLVINNTEFAKNLIDLGCIPKKTFSLIFPNESVLPKQYQSDFIRGYIDGDGCIYVDENKQLQINILGTKDILEKINFIFTNECKCNQGNVRQINKIFTLDIHGNAQAFKIFKYLYNNEPFCMLRKKVKFYTYYKINEGSYRFFQNIWCEAYPCHKISKNQESTFSCLFCFCPLSCYDDCGGNYKVLSNGWKDCTDCVIPHYDYDYIIKKLRELHDKNKKEKETNNEKHN